MVAKVNKKASAKVGKNSTTSRKPKKLPGFFSLRNQKFVFLVALVFGFAGGGSYWAYTESAAAQAKDLTTVQGCHQLMIDTNSYLRQGSTGSCVRVVQIILNHSRNIYGGNWSYLVEDGRYGSATATAVKAYQQQVKNYLNGGMAVDGLAGQWTFYYLRNVACTDIWARGTNLHSCGR